MVLRIKTDKGPVATLFYILGAPMHLWTRKKLAGTVRVTPHEGTISAFLGVFGAPTWKARLGRLHANALADFVGGKRGTTVPKHPLTITAAGTSRTTAFSFQWPGFLATLDGWFLRLLATHKLRAPRAFLQVVIHIRGFRDARTTTVVALHARINAHRDRALPKRTAALFRVGEPTFRDDGSGQGEDNNLDQSVHGLGLSDKMGN